MEEPNISFKNIGYLLVARLNENLNGLADYVKERVRDHGTKYVILDFKEIRRVDSNGIREIIDTYHALKKTNLYLCHIGDEDKHPHKMLKQMGITRLTGIEVREELERTVIELAQKI